MAQQGALVGIVKANTVRQGSFVLKWSWNTHGEYCDVLFNTGACNRRPYTAAREKDVHHTWPDFWPQWSNVKTDNLSRSTVVHDVLTSGQPGKEMWHSIKTPNVQKYKYFIFILKQFAMPIPLATRSKAWVCGRALVGIVGSNPARGMDVCLLYSVCVVRQRSLQRADPSCRGVLQTVVCVWVWSRENNLDTCCEEAEEGRTAIRYDDTIYRN
jgi:hypothetical protein